MPAATLPGAIPENYDAAYGGIPGAPNPGATSLDAIIANLGNMSQLSSLAAGTQGATAAASAGALAAHLPGYQAMLNTSSGNIADLLKGKVPDDINSLFKTQAAERGVSMGSPGSPNVDANYLLKYLGGSLGMQQLGEQQLTSAIGRTPTGTPLNLSSMLTNAADQQSAQYLANLLKAAPVPAAAANANLQQMLAGISAGRAQTYQPHDQTLPQGQVPAGMGWNPNPPRPSAFGSGVTPPAGGGSGSFNYDQMVNDFYGPSDPFGQMLYDESGGGGYGYGGGDLMPTGYDGGNGAGWLDNSYSNLLDMIGVPNDPGFYDDFGG